MCDKPHNVLAHSSGIFHVRELLIGEDTIRRPSGCSGDSAGGEREATERARHEWREGRAGEERSQRNSKGMLLMVDNALVLVTPGRIPCSCFFCGRIRFSVSIVLHIVLVPKLRVALRQGRRECQCHCTKTRKLLESHMAGEHRRRGLQNAGPCATTQPERSRAGIGLLELGQAAGARICGSDYHPLLSRVAAYCNLMIVVSG